MLRCAACYDRRVRASLLLAAALTLGAGCDRKSSTESTSAPRPATSAAAVATTLPSVFARVEAPEVAVRAEGTTVHVAWSTPPGTGINEDAPFKVRWKKSEGLTSAPPEMKATGANVKDGFDVVVKPLAGAPRATLDGDLDLVVCDVATHSVCLPVRRALDLGFVVTKEAPAETKLEVRLPEAKPR
jgi:hypothetical protein